MQRSIIIDADGGKGASECYAVVLLVIDISNWSQKNNQYFLHLTIELPTYASQVFQRADGPHHRVFVSLIFYRLSIMQFMDLCVSKDEFS